MKEVFGSKPNMTNLRLFFRNPVIQALWSHEFARSEKLKEILDEISMENRSKIYNYFDKVAPAGLQILP